MTNSSESKIHIPIHSLLLKSQHNHGLLQNDYQQYRQYCTRRLSRLRHNKIILQTSGTFYQVESTGTSSNKRHKHAFVKKKLTLNESNNIIPNEKFLLILIIQAERAWAHGMEYKYNTNEKIIRTNRRKRELYLRKFKKSVQYMSECMSLLTPENSSAQTLLESKGYFAYLTGNYELEKRHWLKACRNYHESIETCQKLLEYYPPATEAARSVLCERVEQVLQPLLRFCRYEVKEHTNMSDSQLDDYLQHGAVNTEAAPAVLPQSKKEGGASYTLYFRNKTIHVTNEALCIALLKIDSLDAKNLDDLIQAYEETLELAAIENKVLLQYLSVQKLTLQIKRTQSNLSDATTPEIKTHLYRILVQDTQSLLTNLMEIPSSEDSMERDIKSQLLCYRAHALTNLAQCYANACHIQTKYYTTTRLLLEHALEIAAQAAEECSDSNNVEEMIQLERDITGIKCRLEAWKCLSSYNAKVGVVNSLDHVSIQEEPFLVHVPILQQEYVLCKPSFFDLAWNYLEEFDIDDIDECLTLLKKECGVSSSSSGLLGWFRR